MALTDAQKASVRRWLGYPDVNRQAHSGLEGALTALSSEGEAVVVAVLDHLATIDETLQSSWGRQKVLRAEDVTLAGGDEIVALRREGRRLVGQVAAALDVQPLRDVFGGAGASGVARRGA